MQGRIQPLGLGGAKKRFGGQKHIFAPAKLPFLYTYHVKGGQ